LNRGRHNHENALTVGAVRRLVGLPPQFPQSAGKHRDEWDEILVVELTLVLDAVPA
jgi:hypothetical protein